MSDREWEGNTYERTLASTDQSDAEGELAERLMSRIPTSGYEMERKFVCNEFDLGEMG